ncbi:MAG TPA: hypothetical protein PLT47_08460 [Bacteroidales bacterium]|nr:hypothetical protein [Bacteroidales bacterium]HQI70767.1 hypothetical protein [Bacteroidales bacterium]
MNNGWKPLPVILKIIYVILMFRVFFSFFSLSPSFDQGFDFFGFTLYGLIAINIVFIFKVLLPLVILLCMHKRYMHTWLIAVAYFLVSSLSVLFNLMNTSAMLARALEQMPELFQIPQGISEDEFSTMLKIAFALSIIFSALFELAIMILFFVKRKYFRDYRPEENLTAENSSGQNQ